MDVVLYILIIFVLLIWWVRPIYNFAAKRKYQLLDLEKLTVMQRIQTWLPAILFYGLILSILFYPAFTNNLIGTTGAGSIFVIQVLFLFLLTRFDKRQTKYRVEEDALRYRKRTIKWDQHYRIKFKKTKYLILHKPRFIMRTEDTKITIPMLSHNIQQFIKKINETNHQVGELLHDIYENTRVYYVENVVLEKNLGKIK